MVSLEDLTSGLFRAPQKIRDMSDGELKALSVNGYAVFSISRGEGKTVLSSLGGSASLANHCLADNAQAEIDQQVQADLDRRNAARDRITAENQRRHYVMKFGEKY